MPKFIMNKMKKSVNIRQVGYYMHKFIMNKMKKRVNILSFLVYDFFFPGGECCF